jgi:calcium-dependent protein kinase
MYILLSGKYPFYGSSEEEITKKILTGNFDFNDKHFQDVSENAKDLIKKCLIHDKNKRITVKEAIRHEFFASEIDINNIFEDEIDTKIVLNNLKNNSKKISKFYQTVLAYLSYNFADKEELKKLRNIFFKIDLNLDGKLSKEELFIAYREAGINISKEELEKIIKSIDFDGNGYIEYEEFIRVTLNKEQLFSDVNLKTAFDMFDEDKNGTISLNEILKVIVADKDIDKTVIDQLKAEILKDGDENINFKHFKDIMLGLKNDNISI